MLDFDTSKKDIKYNNYSGLPVKMRLLRAIKARITWDFSTLLHIKQGEMSKLIFKKGPNTQTKPNKQTSCI